MKTLVAIRTYRWGEEEEHLFQTLKAGGVEHLVAVIQNPADDLRVPVDVVPLTSDWLEEVGLRLVSDWGWRCGDYFYYALRRARPDFDYYWLVEPDVYFSSSPGQFFRMFEATDTDVLGLELEGLPRTHRFARGMPPIEIYKTIFALTRFSGRALDCLFALRREYSKADVMRRDYANDEVFVFSHAMAQAELTVGNLRKTAPSWFDNNSFQSDPDILIDSLINGKTPAGQLFHPVRSRSGFIEALSKRFTSRLKFLEKIAGSLAELDDGDIEEVTNLTGQILRRNMRRARRMGKS